ncbi:MAG: response regulator transcription factor [Chloroflexi bacterium]|nr:response regulator transcription factor [Chloroflexota bacterium]
MESIKVLVVDDHPVVRQGLRSMLATTDGIEVAGEACDETSALEAFRQLQPDVILLDVRMPGSDGIRVIRHLKQIHPEVKVIVLSTYDEDEYLFGALREGAHGYLLKNISCAELSEAIRQVNNGERLLGRSLTGRILRQFETLAKEKASRESILTGQEIAVLKAIAEGCTNREIAERQYWSEITVKRKVQDIFHKLGVTDRTQAVAEAIRRDVI